MFLWDANPIAILFLCDENIEIVKSNDASIAFHLSCLQWEGT